MDHVHAEGAHQLSFFLCFALGALHALEPGHGKTAMAAHLLSRKGLLAPALAALSTAISHSVSILVIATLVHGALDLSLEGEPGAQLFRYLHLLSGLILVGVSAWVFFAGKARQQNCACPEHSGAWKSLDSLSARHSARTVILGFAVGLIPCPTALVALSHAVVSRDWGAVVMVTFTFSAGIFAGLFAVGSLLGMKLAPALLAASAGKKSAIRYAQVQALVIFCTGAWHVYAGYPVIAASF